MTSCTYDVAVVGFGPVGAVAAALFGRAGLRVLVVDRACDVYDKPRAVAIDHEIMRIVQGLGLAERVAPLTAPFTLSEHLGADGTLIRRVGMLPPPYPMGWTPTMAFLQPDFERVVRTVVGAMPSVDVRLGTDLVGLRQDEDGVELALRETHGVVHARRARYVVGCDGASSTVRPLIGVALEDLGFDEAWLVIDLLVNEAGARKLPQVSTHFYDPERPALFVACVGDHRRFEMMLLPGEDPRRMEEEARVWGLLARWIDPADTTLWRRASYRFHALLAGAWRRGRVFLAGDAAHQQPPFLGQGMCQGVRDVFNLSWKLTAVLAGEAPDALLDTYADERRPHVRDLTTTIRQIGRRLCELDAGKARARDAQALAETGGVAPTLVRQQMIPPLRAGLLSAAATDGARGTLFPQPWVLGHDGPALLDDVAGTGWRVVLGPDARDWRPQAPPSFRVLHLAATYEAGAWQELDGVVADWMARHGCRAAIVQPDHYVFAAVDRPERLDAELAGLAAALGTEADRPARVGARPAAVG